MWQGTLALELGHGAGPSMWLVAWAVASLVRCCKGFQAEWEEV